MLPPLLACRTAACCLPVPPSKARHSAAPAGALPRSPRSVLCSVPLARAPNLVPKTLNGPPPPPPRRSTVSTEASSSSRLPAQKPPQPSAPLTGLAAPLRSCARSPLGSDSMPGPDLPRVRAATHCLGLSAMGSPLLLSRFAASFSFSAIAPTGNPALSANHRPA